MTRGHAVGPSPGVSDATPPWDLDYPDPEPEPEPGGGKTGCGCSSASALAPGESLIFFFLLPLALLGRRGRRRAR